MPKKCEHGLRIMECYVCISPKQGWQSYEFKKEYEQLAIYYDAKNMDELVLSMEKHIERLQKKIDSIETKPVMRDGFAPREG